MIVIIEDVIPCECGKCDESSVVFSIESKKYHAFSGLDEFSCGEVADVCLDYLDGNTAWGERFNRNTSQSKSLVHTGKWSYDGFGQIVSLNPVVADFGSIELELGYITHDTRCVGEYIYERIERLDIFRKVNNAY